MSLKLQQGDRVLIELRTSEVYEGSVEYASSRCIELYDISCLKTKTNFKGNMTFYKNEVAHTSITKQRESPDVPSTNGVADFPTSKKITMDPEEFDRLKQMTFDFIFVDSFGKRFDDVVEELSNRESLAVVGLVDSYFRGKGLGLLVVSDFKKVFIFDMVWLVQLKGLKDILESTFITKVVHDGAPLYDCLYHKYKIQMMNVFDTKIVDSMLSGQDNISRNISEILTHYFNFPPSLLSAAVDDMTDRIWVDRPISRSDRIKAAQLATYLLPLRDRLMGQILKPYTTAIESEYAKFKNNSSGLLKFK